ncbi:GNAT family N-acetyltransferase [Actinoplanes sp. NPDC049596]|uniref:GNAT family N-acetyltransferase n=1 Tax=unclassified Actinoplanes TaxID=2626549 RepID=UPI0034365BA4
MFAPDEWLPVSAGAFDVVLDRHGRLDAAETARVLSHGGTLLTQQVGSDDCAAINEALGAPPADAEEWNADVAVDRLSAAGLRPQSRAGWGAVIELRVLSTDDWPVWRELRLAALAEAPYAFGSRLADWQGDGDRAERWQGRLGLAGSHNVVALLDGEPVGMASGVPAEEAGVVELISMWVSPAARGRGVGDRLIHEVEEWARRGRARVLRLSVMRGNAAAEKLYRRCGFVATGVSEGQEDVMEKRYEA